MKFLQKDRNTNFVRGHYSANMDLLETFNWMYISLIPFLLFSTPEKLLIVVYNTLHRGYGVSGGIAHEQ